MIMGIESMDLTTNQCPKCSYVPIQEFAEFECCINCGSLLIERPIMEEAKPRAKEISQKRVLLIVGLFFLGLFIMALYVVSIYLNNPSDILYLLVALIAVNPIGYFSAKRNWQIQKVRLKRAVEEVIVAENHGTSFFMWMESEAWILPVSISVIFFFSFLFIEFFSLDTFTLLMLGGTIFTLYIVFGETVIKTAYYHNVVYYVSENGIERRTINRVGEPDIFSIKWGEITRIKVKDRRNMGEGSSNDMDVTLYSGQGKMGISNYLINSDEFFKIANTKIPSKILGDIKITPFSHGKPIKKIADL
jgi:hypothetical protein